MPVPDLDAREALAAVAAAQKHGASIRQHCGASGSASIAHVRQVQPAVDGTSRRRGNADRGGNNENGQAEFRQIELKAHRYSPWRNESALGRSVQISTMCGSSAGLGPLLNKGFS